MKLSARDANRYFAKPDPDKTGLLIFGEDAMRVALKRQQVIAALLGENAEGEMRLTRMSGADLRSNPAAVLDEIKAVGFFPGPRAVFVEEATDNIAPALANALSEWAPGDAQVIVTAKQLTAKSALRKLFEGHPNAFAVGIYDDPPSREEIEGELSKAGITVDRDAMTDLVNLSKMLDPGDFRQTVEKLSLYKYGDNSAATPDDVLACAPTSTEAALDDVLNIVAEGRSPEVGPIMRKLQSQGVNPVTLCIGLSRHFKTLHAAASDPGGAASGIGRVRPPVFGPRRDRMVRQASKWGMFRLEQALTILTDTDLQLRSTSRAPAMAVVERAMIRIAMLAAR